MEKIIGPFKDEYHFLSNMYLCDINHNGIDFKSIEHAYQAMKAVDFNDMIKIANTKSPYTAKKLVD